MAREGSEKGKLQRLRRVIRKFRSFISRPYIWSGLLAGFLWAFPAPFVLTVFSSSFRDFPEEAMWIIFFPLKSSLQLTQWINDLELVDPLSYMSIIWVMSVFVGMFLGVTFTYSVHRILAWRRAHATSKETS